jgi:hypothetical protein
MDPNLTIFGTDGTKNRRYNARNVTNKLDSMRLRRYGEKYVT